MQLMTPSGTLITHPWYVRLLAQLGRRARARGLLALALVAAGACSAPAQATRASVPEPVRYIAQTGHNLRGRVLAFYDHHGGAAIFGLPLTEQIADGDLQVQYFECARFELRADGIALTLLGRALTEGRSDAAFAWRTGAPSAERTFYPQSGHSLGGAFGVFWQTHGGIPIFGYPISEELTEHDLLVQYFERARLEYHPEQPEAKVQVSALGRDEAQQQEIAPELLAPAPPILPLATATIAIPNGARRNVELAARRFDGLEIAPGAEVSFLRVIGEVSARRGYESGQAIVNGAIGSSIGGGICYVATALYRAVFTAGLDVVERHAHSLALASLRDIPGFDAAVESSGTDLRWRNDTPHPLLIAAVMRDRTLTVTLFGQGDGRLTTIRGPALRRTADQLHATIGRRIVAANGQLIRKDLVVSAYRITPPTTARDGGPST